MTVILKDYLQPFPLQTGHDTRGADTLTDWQRFGDVVVVEHGRVYLRVHREQVPATTARLLAEVAVADLVVENPPLERVIDRMCREGGV